jgi:hypothetical protein
MRLACPAIVKEEGMNMKEGEHNVGNWERFGWVAVGWGLMSILVGWV